MVKLPSNVTVHAGGRKWRGEIPAAFCPAKLRPKSPVVLPPAPPRKPRRKKK